MIFGALRACQSIVGIAPMTRSRGQHVELAADPAELRQGFVIRLSIVFRYEAAPAASHFNGGTYG
jgi:hypothetical protein